MLLSVRNLCTDFPVKRGIVHAVEDVSFDVDAGEILAIVGESGSGQVRDRRCPSWACCPTRRGTSSRGRGARSRARDLLGLTEKDMRASRAAIDMAMISQEPMTSLNPVYTHWEPDRRSHPHRTMKAWPRRRRARPAPSTCCARCGIPSTRKSGIDDLSRTSCPAACASAS